MSAPALIELAREHAQLLAATIEQGFSEPVARAGLSAELDAWTQPGAIDAVLAELPADLDAARLPRSVLVIAARTLPASTMRAVLMARLLGAAVVLKPAGGQRAIADALATADPGVQVADFASSDVVERDRHIDAVDAIVVLGSDATIAAVRAATPDTKAFVGYGHRVSAAWLEAPDDDALAGLATDLCAWDQAGCLSPQVAWIANGDPEPVATRLAAIVRERERTLPMILDPAGARQRAAALARAQMLGTAHQTDTTVLATLPQPGFVASPGQRFLWLLPADEAALTAIAPHLSALSVCGAAPELPDHVRRCAPGQLQRPPLMWPHDGRPNLTPLLRP